ncbi:ornithine decarboxylase antizyme like protein [Teratosphaeria destructans]|uniref:Ornithine decarboxylase antizyme n=1 Tax=Teratosphaeria destructans TaxID=418781 RepID=A0A9W7SM00_9PEZI|nr:ornithine decarboxylase antizyme like protein [Teratosphaeria destructans]
MAEASTTIYHSLTITITITTTTTTTTSAHLQSLRRRSKRASTPSTPHTNTESTQPPHPPLPSSLWLNPMALLQDNNLSMSSNNHYAATTTTTTTAPASRKSSTESARRSNTQASAYAVDAATMALTGFHFSTTSGAGGARPRRNVSGDGDAAHHVTGECERLFCETLKAVFLVEKGTGLETSLVMGVQRQPTSDGDRLRYTNRDGDVGSINHGGVQIPQNTIMEHALPTPSPSPDGRNYPRVRKGAVIREYMEMWDYTGGARFRGFVAEKDDERALFVFFDKAVIGKDLKPGLMALLELAGTDGFDCSQLVICVDRTADDDDVKDTTRDLGWVGFELMTLDAWSDGKDCVSERWIFLSMDV